MKFQSVQKNCPVGNLLGNFRVSRVTGNDSRNDARMGNVSTRFSLVYVSRKFANFLPAVSPLDLHNPGTSNQEETSSRGVDVRKNLTQRVTSVTCIASAALRT